MANRKQDASDLLGQILKRMLEDTGVYTTRREWARRLRVDESLVSRWINKDTLIQPHELDAILTIVDREGNRKQATKALKYFWQNANAPPSAIAPNRGLQCSLGEWAAKAPKDRLMATLEGRDGYRQRLIAHLATKLELFASKCEYELGEEPTRQFCHDLIGHYVERMAEVSTSEVRKDMARLARERKRREKLRAGNAGQTFDTLVEIADDNLVDNRRQLLRGFDVATAIEAASQLRNGIPRLLPRTGPMANARNSSLTKHSIGCATWQWCFIPCGASIPNAVVADETVVIVFKGELEISVSGHDEPRWKLGSSCVARLSGGNGFAPFDFHPTKDVIALVVSVVTPAKGKTAPTSSGNASAPQVLVGKVIIENVEGCSYSYSAANAAKAHAKAYERKEMARCAFRDVRRKGELIDFEFLKVSSEKHRPLLDRHAAFHGGHEMIIPLKGAVGALFGEINQTTSEMVSACLRKFTDPKYLKLEPANPDCSVPDLLTFNGMVPHALYAAGDDPFSYAIHLRFVGVEREVGDVRDKSKEGNVHLLRTRNLAEAGGALSGSDK